MPLHFHGFKKMLNFEQANNFLPCCFTLGYLKKALLLP